MYELKQVTEIFKHQPLSGRPIELLKLLRSEGEILDMSIQLKNDEGLYIRYSGEKYFNFTEITKVLYNDFDLVVRAFDVNGDGTRTVWLCTKNYLRCVT